MTGDAISVEKVGEVSGTPGESEKVEANVKLESGDAGKDRSEDQDQDVTQQDQPPSKKSLKRLAKRIEFERVKKLKRATQKQKLKEKRIRAKEDGTLMPITRKLLLKTVAPIDYTADVSRVAIDLSFDEFMTTSEKAKTCKQLLRVYTLNRRAPIPMPLYFCGMKADSEIMQIFEKNDGYQHWDVRMRFNDDLTIN